MESNVKNSKVFGGSSGAHAGKKAHSPKRWIVITACILAVLIGCYLLAVYSNISFIAKLRTLYIETAMSTLNHKWLATALIPSSVIDKVMADVDRQMEENLIPESTLPPGPTPGDSGGDAPGVTPPVDTGDGTAPAVPEDPVPEPTPLEKLLEMFPQIDASTIPEDLELEDIQVHDITDLGIYTTAGDPVWAIDMPNQILIMEIDGYDRGIHYNGKLALCKDSSRTILGVNTKSTYRGLTVVEYCEEYGGVISINASGFKDADGKGRGNEPVGLILSEGEIYSKKMPTPYQIAGFDYDDNFRVGYNLDTSELRDAMQFYPILIEGGEKKVGAGSFGMGIQPRSCIGQTSDKDTLLLVIDGRQTHSVGCTVSVCADVLLRYDCFTAMHNDGGSSAVMTYMGMMITQNSSAGMVEGRYLPAAWLVLPPSEETEE